jgi:hypothetical protein
MTASPGVDFYHQNIASKMSGYFDSELWSTLILQLSQSEPVVRHAISAISAAHRDMEEQRAGSDALEECTTAMRCLSIRIDADPTSRLIPLVACLLFTCLEFMRGNVNSAKVHMLSGLNILNSSRRRSDRNNSCTDDIVIEKHLVPVFARLNILCLLFHQLLPPVRSALQIGESNFTTLTDARTRLIEVMDPSLRFIRTVASKNINHTVVPEDYTQQFQLQCELQHWHNQLEDLLSKLKESEQTRFENSINLIRIQHRVVFIWLSVCLTIGECAVDIHTADFIQIVDLSEKLTQEVDPSRPQSFSFEMQIIAPLYYTAVKCRVPSLRRRALDLLRLAPNREGLWSKQISIRLAERVIEIEERGLYTGQGILHDHPLSDGSLLPPETSRVRRSMPPETARLHNISELPGEFRHIDGDVVTSSSSASDRIRINFMFKPWGLDGPWDSWEEEILI